jgi:H+-translocating NAD(P) transhydrogenase subunit alpha
MKIVVPKEASAGERRVALVPESAARIVKAGGAVAVEQGAGWRQDSRTAAYEAAGATTVVADRRALLADAARAWRRQLPVDDLPLLPKRAAVIRRMCGR